MEEEKAAALYDELTRKGEGAARFKQGLGFSSASNKDAVPSRSSALPIFSSSSSFLSTFVKASSAPKTAEVEKQAQLESIQNKLKKKQPLQPPQNLATTSTTRRVSRDRDTNHSSRRSRSRDSQRSSRRRSRSRSRSRDKDRRSKRLSRSRSRDRDSHSRRRSRSRSRNDNRARRGHRSRSRERERKRGGERGRRNRSSSESPAPQGKREKSSTNKLEKERIGRTNFAELIEGYDKMMPAEKVKAKMKLQLSETAEKDETKGMGSGWERFDFDKDAPLDDEEIEAAEDDAALVKHIGQSFRFTTVEARRDEEIKAAHDEAMFGASSLPSAIETDEEGESKNIRREMHESATVSNLLSDQVLTMQQGSWRDRVRKL